MDDNKDKAGTSVPVGINIQMEHDGKTARYIQTGIMTERGFTGLIIDHVGSGQYQDFYFIDGKELQDDEMDMSDVEEALQEAVPGIIDAIYGLRDRYITIDEVNWVYYANEELLKLLPSLNKEKLFSEGADIKPVSCKGGMTRFPGSAGYVHFATNAGQ